MTNQEIVAKLWNLCNVLRDDGITYHQYVTELTYILFLKMAKETGTEDKIPEKYRWDRLAEKDGLALKKFYEDLLRELGEKGTGRIQEIYSGARSNIEEPANLKKIITNINDLDWYSAKEEGLGNLYEGLLEKNANEKKSGAGQYFTPRVLIDIMTELIAPQPGERCNDPACGTFGFMIAADAYVKAHTDDLFSLTSEQQAFQKNEAFTGAELVHETHRLALMNAMLHDIDGKIYLCDTLSNQGKQMNLMLFLQIPLLEQKRVESVQTEMILHSRQAISSLTSCSIFIALLKQMVRQELLSYCRIMCYLLMEKVREFARIL